MEHKREPHDGAWVYISVPHDHGLQEGVMEACGRHGWPVLGGDEECTGRRLQALRLADACIIDVSAASPDAVAELAFALCERRPVIAMRSQMTPDTPFVDEIARDQPTVHRLNYSSFDDCLEALDRVLGDLAWQEEVARAAPSG